MKLLNRIRTVLVIALIAGITLSATAGGNQERGGEAEQENGDTRIELGNSARSSSENGQHNENEGDDTEADDASSNRSGRRVVETDRPIWALVDHEKTDSMANEVSGIIEDGYTPVGMEVREDDISLLYASTNEIDFDRWIIREFTNLDNLNNEMSAFLLDGWTPMDISKTDAGLSVLFIKGDHQQEILGWRIHEISALDLRNAIDTLEAYRDAGYAAYGVTIDRQDNEFWFLMLQFDRPSESRMARIAVNGFENDEIESGITGDVQNGLLPWGLARGRDATFVLYLF